MKKIYLEPKADVGEHLSKREIPSQAWNKEYIG